MRGKFNLIGTIIEKVEEIPIEIGGKQCLKKIVYVQEDRANNQKIANKYRVEFIGNYADFCMNSDSRNKETFELYGCHVLIIGHLSGWTTKGSQGDTLYLVNLRGERMVILNAPDIDIESLSEDSDIGNVDYAQDENPFQS